MKRNKLTWIIASVVLSLMLSCGSSKKTDNSRKELTENKCEQMALDPNAGKLRAYGMAVSKNRAFARDNAILSARRELSGTIEAAVSGLFTRYRQEHTIGDEQDFTEKSSQAVKEVIDQTVKFAPVICSNSYELKNGSIETHVCLELQTDWEKEIADAMKRAAKDRIDADSQTMREDLENEVTKLREQRNR
ncbi:hypothetical protein HMPREF1076_04352 [Parabacteroides goldsteinii CL02T12C30]|uniref:Lipoprotein n=1 Tax=Parabacteroides goldsteinii CL02T12C30 TaxID=999418 RepID=K6A0Y2_9BACT|nr:hypothetical protein [Parabacteroides goldsteinii]EKN09323.1 hypothetical protein HMPREF1076_04352 [Parabacteroides goldsteinii CL02T12C30]